MSEQVATKPALETLVAGLADNKYFLGRRYAEWCTGAPTLESAVAAAAMAQDEIGHARSLYPLLRDVAGASIQAEPESRTQFVSMAFLDVAFESWPDFVAANFLFDTAISCVLEAAEQSSLQALAQRAKRILEEERLHWLHGVGWVRRLPGVSAAVSEQLANALGRVRPEALSWFDVAEPRLVEEGVLSKEAGVLREQYRSRINAVLSAVSLPLL